MACFYGGLVQAKMVAVSSWTLQSCPILKTLFYFYHPNLWTCTFFVPLLWWPWPLSMGYAVCVQLAPIHTYLFFTSWLTMISTLITAQCTKKHLWWDPKTTLSISFIQIFSSIWSTQLNVSFPTSFQFEVSSQILSLFYFLDWLPHLINLYAFLLLDFIHAFFCFNSLKILLLYSLSGSYSNKFSLVLEISKGDIFGFYVYIFALGVEQLKFIYWLRFSFFYIPFIFI